MGIFFFNDTATTEIYTLALHDALPISPRRAGASAGDTRVAAAGRRICASRYQSVVMKDRKSTRLNSSHANISYAVFCLKKKNKDIRSICNVINTTILTTTPASALKCIH